MKTHTRVAVIGGGVVGCSVLYHLTKAGWSDVVLIERDQLTSGSTWHAAGGFHTLNGDPNVAKLQGYTIGLYDELERISGQSCGLHRSGGLLLADTPERMEWLKMAHARARYLGLETSLLTPSEAKQLLPLIEEKYFVKVFQIFQTLAARDSYESTGIGLAVVASIGEGRCQAVQCAEADFKLSVIGLAQGERECVFDARADLQRVAAGQERGEPKLGRSS